MTSSTGNEADDTPARAIAVRVAVDRGRREFLDLVDHIRPDLHRYCARMTGSVADGEDVVQDTLARAYYQLPELAQIPPLRPWLFRIAHNCAIDFHRRTAYRAAEPLDEADETVEAFEADPEERMLQGQAVRAAVSVFLELRPSQRACVILADVLECTLDETADHLGLTVAAAKAALHRGRLALRERLNAIDAKQPPATPSPALLRYVELFNAHDWDGIRGLLADDVRLDLVSRRRAAGAADVGQYFSNYERAGDWRLEPAWIDDDEVIAFFRPCDAEKPSYFARIEWNANRVTSIRDYRHVAYIGRDLDLTRMAGFDRGTTVAVDRP